MPLADAHVHFFSHRYFRVLLGSPDEAAVAAALQKLGWEAPPEDPAALAARWVAELDRAGVSRAALIASIPGDEASVEAAVSAFPDRFYGYFFANPCAPDAAAGLRAALGRGLLRVPCFFPAMHRYALFEPPVTQALETIASALPRPVVFVHCGVLSVGVRRKLGLPSPFDLRFSNPLDLHGTALRFPHIRFVLPHFGAGFFREALMLADLCPNVFFDTSSSNNWMKYQPGEWTLPAVFARALAVVGPQRLLFGTDSSFFPRGWNRAVFDEQTAALDTIGVPAAAREAIFGGNIEQLLAGIDGG